MNFPTERAAAVLIFLYPVLLLSVRSGSNACFLLLIVLAFFEILRTRGVILAGAWDKTALLYGAAMASFPVATFFSQAYHMNFTGGPYDTVARFLFAVPVYLVLRRLATRYLTVVQYGFIGGALAALLVAILHPPNEPGQRLGAYYLNEIHVGDLALMLGLGAVLSINWDRKDGMLVIALKIAALCAGLWVSVASGTRGAWLAIPIVIMIWVALAGPNVATRTKLMFAAAGIVALVLTYALAPTMHVRINLLVNDFVQLGQDRDTSTGMRVQIWTAALHLFAQNFLFGLGPDQFASHVPELAAAGYLTPMAATFATGETHNEILTRAVTLGVFGLVSMVMIYLVPLLLFVRAARASADVTHGHVTRMAGMLGTCFVTAFFVFGLTVEIFNLKATATFYSLTVAVLLAVATNRATEKPQ